MYDPVRQTDLNRRLAHVYASIRTDGDFSVMEHLSVERVDFCEFGNTQPFRIRIVNLQNDNYDHFYVKRADASRVFGIELEHLLSPNRISYLVHGQTLVEEHIAGRARRHVHRPLLPAAVAQPRADCQGVREIQRALCRAPAGRHALLQLRGDVTPDFEDEQYRVRAIDFDQQTYEGRWTPTCRTISTTTSRSSNSAASTSTRPASTNTRWKSDPDGPALPHGPGARCSACSTA